VSSKSSCVLEMLLDLGNVALPTSSLLTLACQYGSAELVSFSFSL
jgi:hypothetical protein